MLAWTLKGFYQPVDMNGVLNTVKGGSTVPLKFELFAGATELTEHGVVKSLTSAQIACDRRARPTTSRLTATGGTSLRYDATGGQFIYNWQTPKTAGHLLPGHHEDAGRLDAGGPVQAEVTEVEVP